jgi:hypothetical protein
VSPSSRMNTVALFRDQCQNRCTASCTASCRVRQGRQFTTRARPFRCLRAPDQRSERSG